MEPLKIYVQSIADQHPSIWMKLAVFPAHAMIVHSLLSQEAVAHLEAKGLYHGLLTYISGKVYPIVQVAANSVMANIPTKSGESYKLVGTLNKPELFIDLFKIGSQERLPYSDPSLILRGFNNIQFVEGPESETQSVISLFANPIWA